MKRKFVFVIVLTGVYILGFLTYNFFNTDKAIFNRVISMNGYTIQHNGKTDPLEYFIKPEWIPSKQGEKLSVNERLIELHNTSIVIDEVWNRGNNISFSFHLMFDMNHNGGEFLNTYISNEDGTSTSGSSQIMIYDKQQKEIASNGTGVGPGPSFSFNINKENLDLIRDGIHVVHSGLQLHEYSKN